MTTHIPRRNWAAALLDFTARNAGRLTALEEDDTDLGAQQEENGIQLRGVSFDPRDGSVAIMLGQLRGPDGHLTRVVRDIEAIDLWRAETGRDIALRIAHPSGQTLLRFCSN